MYYVSADGERMPLSAFGINESEVFPGAQVSKKSGFDGSLASLTTNPKIEKYSYGISPSTELISVTDSSESDEGWPEGLSTDTPYTDENKAKYDAKYNSNLEEIESLEAQKQSLIEASAGTGTSFPDIDNRLAVLYNQNKRIKAWREAEGTKPAEEDRPVESEKPVEGNDGENDESAKKSNKLVEIANKQVKENGIGDIGAVYQDWAGLGRDEAWCVAFARYCADQAGIELPKENSSTELEKWYKKNNKLSYIKDEKAPNTINYPKPGDFIFVNNNANPDADHTAVVVAVNGDEITTIEGNMGYEANSKTVVKRKKYKYNSKTGFVCTDGTNATIVSIGRN